MAALVAGEQYGLSSRNSNDNTSLIFVKLTDSAYRAIEEYLKNGNRSSQKPTIQFLNNEGHLSIPSTQQAQSSRTSHVFNFSLSTTPDEGTFECLQSTGSRTIESLGTLSHQMWVQANDDVYETTRYRMAAAEEQQKKNCTRVIKPNTADIGRRVKLTAGLSSPSRQPARSFSSGIASTKVRPLQNPPLQQHSRVVSNNHAQKPGNNELMRRPIRERLIQLLAVRPHKKPEIIERLRKDGINEKDKNMLTKALSQVAKIKKDNTYELIWSVWNDVQEDWPFYTEEERRMFKRHKPQNLTPPGSSDTGSSASGQSPTSTHPGSPPSVIQGALKRPGYFETADGIQSKRPRISHYRKTNESYRPTMDSIMDNPYHQEFDEHSVYFSRKPQTLTPPGSSDTGSSGSGQSPTSTHPGSPPPAVQGALQRPRIPHSRKTNESYRLTSETIMDNAYHQDEVVDDPVVVSRNRQYGNSFYGYEERRPNNRVMEEERNRRVGEERLKKQEEMKNISDSKKSSYYNKRPNNDTFSEVKQTYVNGVNDGKKNVSDVRIGYDQKKFEEKVKRSDSPATVTSSQPQSEPKWSDTRTRYPNSDTIQENTVSNSKIPDYLTEYPAIQDAFQRRKYKKDFDDLNREYENLREEVRELSKEFYELEERLRNAPKNSREEGLIRKQIRQAYLRKPEHEREKFAAKKKRHCYLFQKLSHIKRLVAEYDAKIIEDDPKYVEDDTNADY